MLHHEIPLFNLHARTAQAAGKIQIRWVECQAMESPVLQDESRAFSAIVFPLRQAARLIQS
ncbi:hypothetical protein BI347_07345 [Chromobacterium sphagni]|uniref:Uncharacterized protein n=1 Tax=Chromobacterium sphagni TaxID=1903179 RepID=A0A1S1X1C2_9NEIS|nr:hypothetical protein BI347_07345 [Chromobacterium sphagni]OHX17053.1 hypothetical protein BI344_12385 [Chromobacterium sphagni]